MNKSIKKTLKQIGLSDNEIKVYVAALSLDETSPYELSKLTGIPRTTVYDVITDLSLKGLLKLEKSDGFTKQQTKIRAKNPSVIRKQLRKKHTDLYKLEVDLVNILPELKEKYHLDKPTNSDFQMFEGIDGAKKIYVMENEFKNTIPLNVITNLLPMDAFGKEFINNDSTSATKKIIDSKQEVNELIPLNEWTKHILTYQVNRDPNYLKARNYRFIDNPIFEQYQRIAIAGDRLMIVSTEKDEAYGLSIKSASLAKSISSIFKLLWSQATPVTMEHIEKWGKNEFAQAEELNK